MIHALTLQDVVSHPHENLFIYRTASETFAPNRASSSKRKNQLITISAIVLLFKPRKARISVIPAQAGIQEFRVVAKPLDTRFHACAQARV